MSIAISHDICLAYADLAILDINHHCPLLYISEMWIRASFCHLLCEILKPTMSNESQNSLVTKSQVVYIPKRSLTV